MHHIRGRKGANLLAALQVELLEQLLCLLNALLDGDVHIDALALDRVRVAHDRRLGHLGVQDHGRLDLGGADAVAARVDHVVHAARDPDVAVLVAARPVAGHVIAVDGEVGVAKALIVAQHGADGGRPRALEGKEPFGGSLELDTLGREKHRLHPKKGQRGTSGLFAESFGG